MAGQRSSLLVVRELVFGPKRFTDLKDGLVGASPNVLSQRLRELEGAGVVRRLTEGSPAYELTDWGRELHLRARARRGLRAKCELRLGDQRRSPTRGRARQRAR